MPYDQLPSQHDDGISRPPEALLLVADSIMKVAQTDGPHGEIINVWLFAAREVVARRLEVDHKRIAFVAANDLCARNLEPFSSRTAIFGLEGHMLAVIEHDLDAVQTDMVGKFLEAGSAVSSQHAPELYDHSIHFFPKIIDQMIEGEAFPLASVLEIATIFVGITEKESKRPDDRIRINPSTAGLCLIQEPS